MTVVELIQALQAMPQELEVVVPNDRDGDLSAVDVYVTDRGRTPGSCVVVITPF
jgi:hypothetical protein